MKIEILPQGHIINGVIRGSDEDSSVTIDSDFYLRAIRIINDESAVLEISKISFILVSQGNEMLEMTLNEKQVNSKIDKFLAFSKRFLEPREEPFELFRVHSLKSVLGSANFWEKEKLAQNTHLAPSEEIGFLGERFRYLNSEGKVIDELQIIVHYTVENKVLHEIKSIPVIEYSPQGNYIFPLKGAWQVYTNFDDIESHRSAYSQEFALDLARFRIENFETTIGEQPNPNFPSYNQNILAVADGTVVEAFSGIPENPQSGVLMGREQLIQLATKYGVMPVAAGNYVVIDHQNGEFSFYAHMIPSSLKVSTGDQVKQGQIIGKVGNSGHSDGPHLHFQLMDSPDKTLGRGLPCYFINLVNFLGRQVKMIDKARSIVYTKEI